MSMLLAAVIFVVLLAIAIAHFVWALGGTWPIRDPDLLVHTVIGMPGVARVPRLASLGVAIATLAAGILALALADPAAGGLWLNVAGLAAAAVFLARGVIGYTAQWAEKTPLEPFRTLDRRNYSPLCIGIGIGFIALIIMRFL